MPKLPCNKIVERYTIRLYPEDVEIIKMAFQDLGYNEVIREVIHQYANTIREKMNEQAQINSNS